MRCSLRLNRQTHSHCYKVQSGAWHEKQTQTQCCFWISKRMQTHLPCVHCPDLTIKLKLSRISENARCLLWLFVSTEDPASMLTVLHILIRDPQHSSSITSTTLQWGPSVKAWVMTPQRAWRMNIIYLQCQTMRMKRMAVAKQVENVTSHLHNTAASISIHTYFSKPHTQSTHHPRWHKDFHISSSRLRMGIASNCHDLYIYVCTAHSTHYGKRWASLSLIRKY